MGALNEILLILIILKLQMLQIICYVWWVIITPQFSQGRKIILVNIIPESNFQINP